SASDAINRHGHRLEPEVEEPFDGGADGSPDLARHGAEGLTRPGHDPDPDADAAGREVGRNGRAGEEGPPGRAAAGHAGESAPPARPAGGHAGAPGDLERREPDDLVDDAPVDGELVTGHRVASA